VLIVHAWVATYMLKSVYLVAMNSKQWNWPDCVWFHMALCLTVVSWWWGMLCGTMESCQERCSLPKAGWIDYSWTSRLVAFSWRCSSDSNVHCCPSCLSTVHIIFLPCLSCCEFGNNVLALHLMFTVRNFSRAIGRPCCDIWN
jgi:hypothetical protein